MRIDVVLKYLCLARSRSGVKAMCDRGEISVNARIAKASVTVHSGDRVTLVHPTRILTVEIREVPRKQLSKGVAPTYYDVIEDYHP